MRSHGSIPGLQTPGPIGGISTKQRLSQNALAPVLPKAIPLPKPKPTASKAALMSLSFKKKTTTPVFNREPQYNNDRAAESAGMEQNVYDITLAALNASPASPTRYSPETPVIVASPTQLPTHDSLHHFFDPFPGNEPMSAFLSLSRVHPLILSTGHRQCPRPRIPC